MMHTLAWQQPFGQPFLIFDVAGNVWRVKWTRPNLETGRAMKPGRSLMGKKSLHPTAPCLNTNAYTHRAADWWRLQMMDRSHSTCKIRLQLFDQTPESQT